MHKPHRVTFDRDLKDGKTKETYTKRFTVFICARNMANALRRTYKKFPGCRLVPDSEL